ncbi:head maturation protease, ClpP-related [Burkholderia vietnamiensis]|uniref:head maturation protease, ClpP-related n=1 Tax=Burkholderia vietnamiensis TaxID=60552 RepID=UPI00084144CC|nr:head maturation protease, ClpP-related [Burkholderia vietnamiensis]AOK40832.1 peptidase S14 [Burkholderia vietnamiensis]
MRQNRILQLLNDNRGRTGGLRVQAAADTGEVTIYLYDVIVADDWFGGVSAQSFVQALAAITADVIHLRINSPGGDVFAARAIETAIRGHAAKVIAHVDGVAASAASFVMLAADEVEITDGAFVMIHKAWSIAMGNADELKETATLLDAVDASLVRTYAKETGQDEADIAAWMADETWFSSADAIEKGFADRLAGSDASANASAWNLAAFGNAPQAPQQRATTPAPVAAAPTHAAAAPVLPVPDLAAMKRRLDLQQRL